MAQAYAPAEMMTTTDGVPLKVSLRRAMRRNRIRAADEVVLICGEHTSDSPRMAAELRIALEESKPYLLLWGRREMMCTKPIGAKSTDAMYSWTRDVLESQMSATLRNSKPPEVPESCKRPTR